MARLPSSSIAASAPAAADSGASQCTGMSRAWTAGGADHGAVEGGGDVAGDVGGACPEGKEAGEEDAVHAVCQRTLPAWGAKEASFGRRWR